MTNFFSLAVVGIEKSTKSSAEIHYNIPYYYYSSFMNMKIYMNVTMDIKMKIWMWMNMHMNVTMDINMKIDVDINM